MNVVPLVADAWRAYPHVITKGARTNQRWRITIRRVGPPAEDIYSYAGPDLLDPGDRLTEAGRDLIARDLSKRARESNARFCVVWSERSCTWFDTDGTPREGNEPPRGEPVEAAEYRHVPARLEMCHFVKLPKGANAPYLCVTSLNRDYVNISPGDNVAIAFLDEDPLPGDPHPAEDMVDSEGYLIVPKTFRGVDVVEVRDGCNLYGPVQPTGPGVVLRTPWPQDVREACETVAGYRLPEKTHLAVWKAIDPIQWGLVQATVAEAA